jgi:sugar O-acyltransferase (sialic acid O-acetyltransferase NeuD family)
MEKEPILIIGFGGNAIDFFDTISEKFNIISFVDDDPNKIGSNYGGVKVCERTILDDFPNVKIITLLGSEKTFLLREKIISSFNIQQNRFAKIIHSSAIVSSQAKIGNDVVIMPNVVLTSNCEIGNHVMILSNTSIHHDVKINNFNLIGSNVVIAGHVSIDSHCFIGSGSSIKSNCSIGERSLVGMSSNVVKNVNIGSVVMGNPAKIKL